MTPPDNPSRADPVWVDEFLAQHPPFNAMTPADRHWLATRLTLLQVASGTLLAGPAAGVPKALFLLQQGQVRVIDAHGKDSGHDEVMLAPGECFPIGALSGGRLPGNAYVSTMTCELLVLAQADFHELLARSAVFARFCGSYLSALLSQSRAQLQSLFSARVGEQQALSGELRQLRTRAPVAVPVGSALRSALETMGAARIGSIVVVDAGIPQGILTQSDVLLRVVLAGAAMDGPIDAVMTRAPACLAESASVEEAMQLMALRGIRHVLLVDAAGRLSGVVSERNLFALQRVSMAQLRRTIMQAGDIAALQQALADVRQCAFNMVAQGIAAEQITQFISKQNDAVTQRVLQLALARHPLDDIAWCWLAFGSEGRGEQTLSTDQDNGIVFLAPPEQLTGARERLLAFASEVNADLDRCGFPLCKGNIMAGNPQWCLSLDEWQACFTRWVSSPQPQALLHATIFFDLRPLYGDIDLAAQMHTHLFSLTQTNSAFLHMLAANALSVAPPLGMFRDFVTHSDDAGKAYIDLKTSGARLFVDVARVFALAGGIAEAATTARLRRSADLPGGMKDEVDAVVDAFSFIQMLRLRHQHLEAGQGRAGDNRIYVGRLNHLERRILKEAFRQARLAQQRLRMDYRL